MNNQMFILVNPKLGKIWNNTITKIKKMIKVLFKSEELLIAADSESAVVTSQKIPYLSNLTPKNGEEAMSI